MNPERFIKLLPGGVQGYNEGYKATQELMLPLNKQCELTKFDKIWYELRHDLRRESLGEDVSNPFEHLHSMKPDELFAMLPHKVAPLVLCI